MRTALATVAVLLLGAAPAHGDTPESVAARVKNAFRSGDAERVRAIAAERAADPWQVVDALATGGAHDAAEAYAGVHSGPDFDKLPAYAAARRTAPPNREVREALRSAGEARAVLDKLAAHRAEGDDFLQARIEFRQGLLLAGLRRPVEAARAYDRAATRAERVGCLSLAAEALYRSGVAAHETLDFGAMLAAWQRWHALERSRGNAGGIMDSSVILGNVFLETGIYDRALEQYIAAEATARKHKSGPHLRFALENAAVAHLRLGDYRHTQAALEEALELASRADDADGAAKIRQDLADLHYLTGEYVRARSLYEAALGHFEQGTSGEHRVGVARSLGGLGFVEDAVGQDAEALAHYEEALTIFRGQKDFPRVVAMLTNISSLHLGAGHPDEALPSLREALQAAKEIHDPWLEATAVLSLALYHHECNQDEEAEAAQTRALDTAERLASPQLLANTLRQLAAMRLARKRYAEAADAAERSITYQSTLLAGMAAEQGARARARRVEIYATGARAAVALDDVGRLAAFLESGRAGSFLESLQGRDAIRKAAVPAKLIAAEQEARLAEAQAVARFQQAVRSGDLKRIKATRQRLDAAREAVQAAVQQIQREAKRAADVLYPSPAPLAEIQATLGPDEALVLFELLEGTSVALIVTRTGSRIVELAGRDTIAAAVDNAFEALNDKKSDPGAALDALRELVTAPLKLDAKVRRLLVSLDGALFRVPFAPLVGKREVVLVPSGSTYRVLREQQPPRGAGVLALGDPVYREERGLVALSGSRREVESVGTSKFLGEDATEANLRTALAREKPWRAVHLACHGLVDAKRPLLSSLALAQASADDDGGLTALEVFRLEVRAELVVLSACDTGRGEILEGAGLVGLSRSFLFAGAGSVLVSLWKVDDKATRALMVKFYELWNPPSPRLRRAGPGLGAAAALKEAQEYVASHEKWRHPYYWAAWQLWGLPG